MTDIKHRYSGLVLFSHESSSVAETLKVALAKGADLRGANLRGANLRGANLRCAALRDADLSSADLWGADLWGANLSSTDLRGANLRVADLSVADLSGADLSSADLRGANLAATALPDAYRIARLDFGGWSVLVTPIETSIGCQKHKNKKWLKADSRWIAAMDPKATAWWKLHGTTVKAAIRAMPKTPKVKKS